MINPRWYRNRAKAVTLYRAINLFRDSHRLIAWNGFFGGFEHNLHV